MQDLSPTRAAEGARLPSLLKAGSYVLLLVALWLLSHRYRGLVGDAELYAMQALSRIHPALGRDLYLAYGSQDQFTIFSPFYAWCIRLWGLHPAGLALAIFFKIWFFAAAWALARAIDDSVTAVLATALLVVVGNGYGAFDVFHYSEAFLTARSPAEALIVTSIALFLRGRTAASLLLTALAMLVHPLIALPGLLLVGCLLVPAPLFVAGAALGTLICVTLCVMAATLPGLDAHLQIVDPAWREMLRERSIFLFLQYWRRDDWLLNLIPLVSLLVGYFGFKEKPIRKVCLAALTIGVSGLAVGLAAGLYGSVAIMIQGQAWRWIWLSKVMAVVLAVPTAARLWRADGLGPICATLLILGWLLPTAQGMICLSLAGVIWMFRHRLGAVRPVHVRLAVIGVSAVVIAGILAKAWLVISSPAPEIGREFGSVQLVRNLIGIDGTAFLVALVIVHAIRVTASRTMLLGVLGSLAAVVAASAPGSLRDVGTEGTVQRMDSFSAWRQVIPEGATVFAVPQRTSADFLWFTLERPSYLTVDQSAGAVFSRKTALEIRRRSDMLSPIEDANWRLNTKAQRMRADPEHGRAPPPMLTRDSLRHVCADPELGFVIASQDVGFRPLRHAGNRGDAGPMFLYDCRAVNAATPDS